jgi:transposase
MVFELRAETGNARGSIARVGQRLGINSETLRNWVQKAETDSGQRPGTPGDDKKKIVELEREVRELRRANEILRAASSYFAWGLCATRRRVDRVEVGDLHHQAVAAAW